jgi:PKD repeat protein
VQNPSHSYAAGTYTVSLTATNAYGSDGETKTNYITATGGGSPVTIFSDSFNNGLTGWTTEPDARGCYCSSPSNYLVQLRSGGAAYRTISTVGYTSITVTYDMTVFDLEAGEKQEVLWYDGSTWTVLDTIADGDSDEDGNWRVYNFSLPAGANNNANFAIKFDQTASLWDDNTMIDDVIIQGVL